MANEDIKESAKKLGVHLWEIANHFGVTDATFSRRLRIEFADADKEEVRKAISEIKESKEKA